MLTCPCSVDPLTSHFYIVKLVYSLEPNECTHNLFRAKIRLISQFFIILLTIKIAAYCIGLFTVMFKHLLPDREIKSHFLGRQSTGIL